MRVTRIAAVVLVLVGALAAFIGNLPSSHSDSGPGVGPQPAGAAVSITSLPSPGGSTPATVAGVTVDLPKGFTSTTTSPAIGVKQLVVHDPSRTQAVATVTVTQMLRADDAAVDRVSRSTEAKIAAQRGWSGLSLSSATWTGFPYATAIRGTLTHDDGSKSELLLVNVRDGSSTRVVGVSVDAAYGQLEASAGFAILRTMRFSGPSGSLGPLAGVASEGVIVTAVVMLFGVLVGVFVLLLRRYRRRGAP